MMFRRRSIVCALFMVCIARAATGSTALSRSGIEGARDEEHSRELGKKKKHKYQYSDNEDYNDDYSGGNDDDYSGGNDDEDNDDAVNEDYEDDEDDEDDEDYYDDEEDEDYDENDEDYDANDEDYGGSNLDYDEDDEEDGEYNYYDEEEQLEEQNGPQGRVPNEYKLLEGGSEILDRLLVLERRFPDFVTLKNTQDEFNLEPSGDAEDCAYEHHGAKEMGKQYSYGCRHWYIVMEDKKAHPEGSESWKRLPEVFLSGAVHGNERVGPTAVIEAAELLAESAACEELPRSFGPKGGAWNDGGNHSMWHFDMLGRDFCEQQLAEIYGLQEPKHRRWLARLVSTRRIVIMPTPNTLGFHRNEREEGDVDPNHDFPFDRSENPSHCMRTVAARSINEIFRKHMFQLALSFHSGDEYIGYVWGSTQYVDAPSPDEVALYRIAGAYSDFGGKFEETHHYQLLWLNERHPDGANGGFEDWSYAGSWDTDNVNVCTPDEQTYGSYDSIKTVYSDSTLRALNLYIGTSHEWEPTELLGNDAEIFEPMGEGSGNIPRNVRVSLMAVELVQPYVEILAVNGLVRADNGVVPGVPRWDRQSCTEYNVVSVPSTARQVIIEWTVGGSLVVDDTEVVYGKWTDIPSAIGCSTIPKTKEELGTKVRYGTSVGERSGFTQWSDDAVDDGASPRDYTVTTAELLDEEDGAIFVSKIDLAQYAAGDAVAVWAVAKVDGHWADLTSAGGTQPEGVTPQSHVVNARTNPSWHHESAGKIVEGRDTYYSIPLTIVIGHEYSGPTKQLVNRFQGTEVYTDLKVNSTVKKSRNWGIGSSAGSSAGSTSSSTKSDDRGHSSRAGLKAFVVFAFLGAFVYLFVRRTCRANEREMDVAPLNEDSGPIGEGGKVYRDDPTAASNTSAPGGYRDDIAGDSGYRDDLSEANAVEMKNHTIT